MEKDDLKQRITFKENDETLKKCVDELKKQCQQDTLRLVQVIRGNSHFFK